MTRVPNRGQKSTLSNSGTPYPPNRSYSRDAGIAPVPFDFTSGAASFGGLAAPNSAFELFGKLEKVEAKRGSVAKTRIWDVIVVGGGMAGVSAAIYLGRAERKCLVVDSGKSMAKWEPQVENYMGFPHGISGKALLERGRQQAKASGVQFVPDEVVKVDLKQELFTVLGKKKPYQAKFLLLATGIYHIPPNINGTRTCLGRSMFFCKDCDAARVKGKRIAVYGINDQAAEYSLGMLAYSPFVAIVLDGRSPTWSKASDRWLREYEIPVYPQPVRRVKHAEGQIESLEFTDNSVLLLDALFTTRGDIYYNDLARLLGANIANGEVVVNASLETSVKRLYAAGCITPANCQMIIAAGQGATAAQSINRELFQESLANHSLKRFAEQP